MHNAVVVDGDGAELRTILFSVVIVATEEGAFVVYPVAGVGVVPELDFGPGFTVVGRLDYIAVAINAEEQDGNVVAVGGYGVVIGAVERSFPFFQFGDEGGGPGFAVVGRPAVVGVTDGGVVSDVERDILKIVVVNRYKPSRPAVAFIRGFGLRRGALASSVAHDSHNIVAVGVTDKDILHAVNLLIEHTGGVTAYCSTEMVAVPLPVAGLMSNEDGYEVAAAYQNADALAKRLGSTLYAPFMTLAFMALLVIPELKLSDQGLFDVKKFGITSIYEGL